MKTRTVLILMVVILLLALVLIGRYSVRQPDSLDDQIAFSIALLDCKTTIAMEHDLFYHYSTEMNKYSQKNKIHTDELMEKVRRGNSSRYPTVEEIRKQAQAKHDADQEVKASDSFNYATKRMASYWKILSEINPEVYAACMEWANNETEIEVPPSP